MIGYWLIKRLSDKTRLIIGGVLFDLSIVGAALTIMFTDEPPWILGLSWAALTLTAADILSTAMVLFRQGEEVPRVDN